jgi:hypothetical protein
VSLTFYFDEDAAEQALVQALRSRGFQVLIPYEVSLLGADDLVQLRWCAEKGCVLVSHNVSDFWRYHREFLTRGEPHSGLILVQQQSLSIGERLRRLIKLAGVRSSEEMQNRVEFLSAWG